MTERGERGRISVEMAIAIVAILASVLLLVSLVKSNNEWKAECQDKGGHVERVGRGYICVSGDGRLIDTSQ